MGENGDAARAGGGARLRKAAPVPLVGVTVWVAVFEYDNPLGREEIAQVAALAGDRVTVAGLSRAPGLCEAALAYLYTVEDLIGGMSRIRDENIRFLANIVGARQAREALEKGGPARYLVAASIERRELEAFAARLGIDVEWDTHSCVPDEMERVTASRIERV